MPCGRIEFDSRANAVFAQGQPAQSIEGRNDGPTQAGSQFRQPDGLLQQPELDGRAQRPQAFQAAAVGWNVVKVAKGQGDQIEQLGHSMLLVADVGHPAR